MEKKRVIPVLLLRDGRMVKGKQFGQFRDTGDPRSAARIYNAQYADELVFLDIQANSESRGTLLDVVKVAAAECFMPLTVGGGVKSTEDVFALLRVGADKVVVTTAAALDLDMVTASAQIFGSQCIVGGIDFRGSGVEARAWIKCGAEPTRYHPVELAKELVARGAGEIFLNSIDRDGMMCGYDLDICHQVASAVNSPVIACGGAGNFAHLGELLSSTPVSAAACASLFHFGDNNPIRARTHLRNLGIPLRVVK